MRDYLVHWRRDRHTFTVVNRGGVPVADQLETIEQAWAIAERAQRSTDDHWTWLNWRRRIETRRPVSAR
jgi:hypothetical protein